MCGILSAYAFSMTIPSRPAPPPPQSKHISARTATQPIYNNNYSLSSDTSRYTPTTNWDDVAFDNYVQISDIHQQQQHQQQEQHQQSLNIIKKIPPPRPPPPKISIKSLPPLKKPNQPTSINILSNLFGTSSQSSLSTSSSFSSSSSSSYRSRTPTKLQNFSNTTTNNKSSLYQTLPPPTKIQQQTTELISFDSPPSSPTLTQKSNSDCVSIGSCSSDSNNYSPSNNGHVSQAESGFEDDFTLESQKLGTTASLSSSSSFAYVQNQKQQQIKDPFDLIDPFEIKPEIKTKPLISQKPLIIGNSGTSFYTHNSNYNNNNNNNGSKKVLSTSKVTVQAAQQMPTIIKPVIKTPKPKLETISSINNNVSNINNNNRSSFTSLPMPNCPPPPPPTQSAQLENVTNAYEQQQTTDNNESYGFALYDFDAIEEGDLSLRINEKVYIFKKLNDEWFYGKNRRGCEGMFPINYIDIKVPLNVNVVDDNTTNNNKNNTTTTTTTTASATTNNSLIKAVAEITTTDKNNSTMKSPPIVKALYNFNAELPSDLTIYENDMITILYQINSDWLYGQIGTRQGQFPSNFIEYIPSNLPFKTS